MARTGIKWSDLIRTTWDATIEQGKAVPVATFALAWFKSLHDRCKELNKEDLLALSLQAKNMRADKIQECVASLIVDSDVQRREIENITRAFIAHLAETNLIPDSLERLENTLKCVELATCEILQNNKDELSALSRIEDRLSGPNPFSSFRAEIDQARDFLLKRQPDTAIALLEHLKSEKWDKLTEREKYRVEANIGHAYRQKGHLHDAANQFLKGVAYQPDDENAQCLKVEAHLILGQSELAREEAAGLARRYPECSAAIALRILTFPEDVPFKTVEESVDNHLRGEFDVAFELAQRAFAQGELPKAEEYARIAVQLKPDEPYALQVLAEILVEKERQALALNADLRPRPTEGLVEAVSCLTRAIELLGDSPPPQWGAHIRLSRGVALKLSGEDRRAGEDLTTAYAMNPADPNIQYNYALLEAERGNVDDAIDTFRAIAPTARSPRSDTQLARLLIQRGRDGDGTEAIRSLERWRSEWGRMNHEERDSLTETLVEAYMREGRHSDARNFLVSADMKLLPQDVVESHKAVVELDAKLPDEAARIAQAALAVISDAATRKSLIRLASVFYRLNSYKEALALFMRITPSNSLTRHTLSLLDCARRCGDDKFVLAFCKSLRAAGTYDIDCIDFELATLEQYNSFDEAIEVASDVIAKSGDIRCQKHARARRSWLGVRLARPELIESSPALLPTPMDHSPQFGKLVARVLTNGANPHLGVEYAYQLYRLHPDDFHACSAVAETLVPYPHPEVEVIKPDVVQIGAAVQYVDEATEVTHTCIVEDSPDPKLSLEEYPPDHPLVVAMLGKRAGEQFKIPRADRQGRIMSVVSKYVYRWNRCLQEMAMKYPDKAWILGFNARPDPQLGRLVRMMESRNKTIESRLEVYREHPAPAVMLALAVGKSTFETVEIIGQIAGLPIRCCLGNAEEIGSATSALHQSSTLVLDVTALATIFALDALNPVLKYPGEILVSQGTYDEIHGVARSPGSTSTYYTALVSNGKQKKVAALPAQDPKDRAARLSQFLGGLAGKCRIRSGSILADLEPGLRDRLIDYFGRPTAESMVLAREAHGVLWVDDLAVGAIGGEELGIKSAWSQLVFEFLSRTGIAEKKEWFRVTYALLQMGYTHTVINDELIQDAVTRSDWSPDQEPLRIVLDQFANKDVIVQGLFALAAASLRWIWQQSLLEQQALNITIRILDRLASRPKGRNIIGALLENADGVFALDVVSASKVKTVISGWLGSRRGIILP